MYGGLAVIHRDTIRARSILPEAHPANFLKAGSLPPVQLNRLQRCCDLPPSLTDVFLSEFFDLLEILPILPDRLLIVGDFNNFPR
jgi:hypothetical protein